jgi:lysozyme
MLMDDVLAIAKPLIQEFEHCELREYLDIRKLPTIGWGIRISHGQYPNGITQAQADKMFETRIESVYNGVRRIVKFGNPNINEMAALTSFGYNIGFGQWHPFVDGLETSTLLHLYNQGYRKAAAHEFVRWDHADGIEIPGLKRRRLCEAMIFTGSSIADLQKVKWLEGTV